MGQFRLRRRQSAVEVGERLVLPVIEIAVDQVGQDVYALAVPDGLLEVKAEGIWIADAIEHLGVVAPDQLCRHRLHKFGVRVGLGEAPYIV